MDFDIGGDMNLRLGFDLGAMELDCWLAMDGLGGLGEIS